tara:strand:+ start:92 stop:460 length:369 start_codon:yes stop_codon:yes gene_type:complete
MRTDRSETSKTTPDKPSGRASPLTRELTKLESTALYKKDPALWEKRWGVALETGLFKNPPQLAWAQVMIRDLESMEVNMQRVYEKSRARASIIPRMQGVEIPAYEELMTMDLSPQPSEEPVT